MRFNPALLELQCHRDMKLMLKLELGRLDSIRQNLAPCALLTDVSVVPGRARFGADY